MIRPFLSLLVLGALFGQTVLASDSDSAGYAPVARLLPTPHDEGANAMLRMEEILAGNTTKNKTFYFGYTRGEIRGMVTRAWKRRVKFGPGKGERYIYRGFDPRFKKEIEFMYNPETKTVESAYPRGWGELPSTRAQGF